MKAAKKKILIATTNEGKFYELTSHFSDLNFDFVNLKDVKLHKEEPEEPFETTWENSIAKARFYAKKSGLLTIAEDTGFFIKHLEGWPGVNVKRHAPTPEERIEKILDKMKSVPLAKRDAYFMTTACLYEPDTDDFHIFNGKAVGKVAQKRIGVSRPGMEHDPIFYYPPLKKYFSELSIAEKNQVSHRGEALAKLRIYLNRTFQSRQLIVPAAIIVKDRKMLITQRRDVRPNFNGRWEFPGGGVENGEEILDCLKRETREETGYRVSVLEQLPEFFSASRGPRDGNYQVFLMLFVCKINSGVFKTADEETIDHRWVSYKEALKLNLINLNRKVITSPKNLRVLKKYID